MTRIAPPDMPCNNKTIGGCSLSRGRGFSKRAGRQHAVLHGIGAGLTWVPGICEAAGG